MSIWLLTLDISVYSVFKSLLEEGRGLLSLQVHRASRENNDLVELRKLAVWKAPTFLLNDLRGLNKYFDNLTINNLLLLFK